MKWILCYIGYHDWREVGRKFTEPRKIEAKGLGHHQIMNLVFGFTTIERLCDRCRVNHFRAEYGDQTKD